MSVPKSGSVADIAGRLVSAATPRTRSPLRPTLSLMLTLLMLPSWCAAATDKEAAVRSAFLYRLAFFVTWSDQSFADRDSPLRLCMQDADPQLTKVLREQTRTRTVHERRLEVVRTRDSGDWHGCHLLYLGPARSAPWTSTDAERAPRALIVVERIEDMAELGALALVREEVAGGEARLVFHGHRQRIQSGSYNLSSQLLQLVRFDAANGATP